MRVIVLAKQVPELASAKLDRRTLALVRGSVLGAINPADRCALEMALRLCESCGGEVLAVCMGPEEAGNALRWALAMGAQEAALIADAALVGSDAYITALCLARACQRLAPVDLILTGQTTTDGGCGQVGPRVAEELGLPHLSEVRKIEPHEGGLAVMCGHSGKLATFEVRPPALLAVAPGACTPRYPSAPALVRACQHELLRFSLADLGLQPEEVGSAGSPTRVVRAQPVEGREGGVTLRGSAQQVARELLSRVDEQLACETLAG